jgi:CBS domain-containing protein
MRDLAMEPAHRRVRDVMTSGVVTAGPGTTFKRIAELLTEHEIGAVPIVGDDGRPVGVVSEADLLRTQEYPPGSGPVPLGQRLLHPAAVAKAGGRTARDLMTILPATVGPDASLAHAARRMLRSRVRRLLVVDDEGLLAGVVTRGDLLRVFLRDDEAIRVEIHEGVIARELCQDPLRFRVGVRDGVVDLAGQVDRRDELPLLLELVAGVEGVVRVDARLMAADDRDAVRHVVRPGTRI